MKNLYQFNFRCSLNAISSEAYHGGPYLLLMHPDPNLEGRLRYTIPEGRTRLGRVAAGRTPSLYREVSIESSSSICDFFTKGNLTTAQQEHNTESCWLMNALYKSLAPFCATTCHLCPRLKSKISILKCSSSYTSSSLSL